ncbi:unnamed protein product [Eruca vesicaria subsp. sativa]|uniref:Uncharacterized protein n=1 Tax=Eruca vesicaria subsp. sativa TaxID=29727 RepID=A0ABC8J1Z5_ERUVS|nr:unnamed protein product [Eruca vesicaria subsp. sativa]
MVRIFIEGHTLVFLFKRKLCRHIVCCNVSNVFQVMIIEGRPPSLEKFNQLSFHYFNIYASKEREKKVEETRGRHNKDGEFSKSTVHSENRFPTKHQHNKLIK